MHLVKLCIFTFFMHSLYASNWHHEEPKRTLPPHPYLHRSTGQARNAAPMNRLRVQKQEQHYTIERRQGSSGSISSLDPLIKSTEPYPKDE